MDSPDNSHSLTHRFAIGEVIRDAETNWPHVVEETRNEDDDAFYVLTDGSVLSVDLVDHGQFKRSEHPAPETVEELGWAADYDFAALEVLFAHNGWTWHDTTPRTPSAREIRETADRLKSYIEVGASEMARGGRQMVELDEDGDEALGVCFGAPADKTEATDG